MTSRRLSIGFLLAFVAPAAASQAASNKLWDGTWSGLLNHSEPVSVTIAGGRVVGYAIRGGEPFGIQYSKVTLNSVSFGDRVNYSVIITKKSASTAFGVAHGPMGDGSASLTRQ
jgi:hypothetical protein